MAGLNSLAGISLGLRRARPAVLAAMFGAVLCWVLNAQESPVHQTPSLKVSVYRVNVGVTVTDSDGKFVSGLKREDFRIFDNDLEQPIADFLPVEEPAQFLLLIESGPSVLLFKKNHVLTAGALLTSVAADDRVAIATYTRMPELAMDFTADKEAALQAMRSIDFRLGYGELDLSTSVATAAEWLARLSGKKTIVLLSTGVDSAGPKNWETLRNRLQTADVRILAVSLAGDIRKPVKRRKLSVDEQEARAKLKEGFAEADNWLKQLSEATGGRVYFARNAKELGKAYAEIAQLLRHEYSLAFAPRIFDGKTHALRVEVRPAGLRVGHRPAYVAASMPDEPK